MRLILENIRCFAGRHVIPVTPLTLLTGENSSGKSTFLASLAAVHDPFGFPTRPRFNEPPYNLGNFDTIATYKGGRYGRAHSICLGYEDDESSRDANIKVIATYTDRQGLLSLSDVELESDGLRSRLSFTQSSTTPRMTLVVEHEGKTQQYEYDIPELSILSGRPSLDDLLSVAAYRKGEEREQAPSRIDRRLAGDLIRAFSRPGRPRAISIAPIRTKPKRTYDQISEEFSPEGEHVPFVLSNLLNNPDSRHALERFGEESGLFNQVGIKKLGDKISDPIQVMVTSSGRPANLLDVGYGVSQALPVVVQSVLAAPQNMLLLQQPEVHLHPRAQAALGSLFVDLSIGSGKSFVVETHSDYIIDRVRQEVANGNIPPRSVSILYFERAGMETSVYPLTLDKAGNILNTPPSYRQFFLQEELALFQRGSDVKSKG